MYVIKKSSVTLFKSLVRPQLEYAWQVWSPYAKKKILAIERVQSCATKFIFWKLTYVILKV